MGALVELRPWHSRRERTPSIEATDDADFLPIGVVLWAGSVVRVAEALGRHEVVGKELILAIACVLLIPWLLLADRQSRRSEYEHVTSGLTR